MGANKTGRTTDMLKKAYESAIAGGLTIVVGTDPIHAIQLCQEFARLHSNAVMEIFTTKINVGKGTVQFMGAEVKAKLSGYGEHTLFRDHSVPNPD